MVYRKQRVKETVDRNNNLNIWIVEYVLSTCWKVNRLVGTPLHRQSNMNIVYDWHQQKHIQRQNNTMLLKLGFGIALNAFRW